MLFQTNINGNAILKIIFAIGIIDTNIILKLYLNNPCIVAVKHHFLHHFLYILITHKIHIIMEMIYVDIKIQNVFVIY